MQITKRQIRLTLPSSSFDGFLQPDDTKTLAPSQLPSHQARCRNKRIIPVSEHGFHVARYTLEDNRGDRHERAILLRDGEDGEFLGEKKSSTESLRLGAGECANDAVVLSVMSLHFSHRQRGDDRRLTCTSRKRHPKHICAPAPNRADRTA